MYGKDERTTRGHLAAYIGLKIWLYHLQASQMGQTASYFSLIVQLASQLSEFSITF
jgi:hypothetical protein